MFSARATCSKARRGDTPSTCATEGAKGKLPVMWEKKLNGSLSDADREKIWLLAHDGMNASDIAKRFNVSPATISRELQNRRARTNVTAPARARQAAQSA